MFADLHIHTHYSDGTYSPLEIAVLAHEAGLKLISVCDHNTMSAYPEFEEACKKYSIAFISGVEIDSSFNGSNLHVLGYGCDRNNSELDAVLRENVRLQEKLSYDLIFSMQRDYPDISIKEYEGYTRDLSRGGWKGIDYLRTKGLSGEFPQCMKYYKDYGVKQEKPFPDFKEVCDVIHKAGGKALLAHPGDRLNNSPKEFIKTLMSLAEHGLDGVECYYPSHTDILTRTAIDFCHEYDMLITTGGDFHGEFAKVISGIDYTLGGLEIAREKLVLKDLIVNV